jgi:hypothetical protein
MTVEEKKWLRFRIATLLSLFLVFFIALITRAYQIQVLNGQSLKARADRQHTTTLRVESERGIIFDRNGEKLAVSVMSDSVCADPSKIKEDGCRSEYRRRDSSEKTLRCEEFQLAGAPDYPGPDHPRGKAGFGWHLYHQGTEAFLSQWGIGRSSDRFRRAGCQRAGGIGIQI